MRVADSQLFGALVANFQRVSKRMMADMQQVSSGKRVSRPSDDPSAFNRIVLDKSNLARTEQWIRNIGVGTTRLDTADGSLREADGLLSRIKELAVQARSDTMTATDRALIAKEVRGLHRELIQIANAEMDGQRVFAGTKTNVEPFVLGAGDAVTYQGNAETQSIAVGKNQTVQIALPGGQVFTGPSTNVFDGIANLLAALESNNGAGIETGIGAMDGAIAQVTDAQGQIGALTNRLDSTMRVLEESAELVKLALTRYEDADYAAVTADLSKQQVAMEAAAKSASMLFENSLLRFLR